MAYSSLSYKEVAGFEFKTVWLQSWAFYYFILLPSTLTSPDYLQAQE